MRKKFNHFIVMSALTRVRTPLTVQPVHLRSVPGAYNAKARTINVYVLKAFFSSLVSRLGVNAPSPLTIICT